MIYIPEPDTQRRERHLAFIEANLRQLRTAAVAGHEECGRGMLFLDEADFVDKPRGVLTRYSRLYIAEGTELFSQIGGTWPGTKEEVWVGEYDPGTTMLVCFARRYGGVSSYRVSYR